jgi:fructuronate reductase
LRAGHEYVHEAIADPALRSLAEQLMRNEAAPTITTAPGQDLAAYADALIARFANPSLNHRLIQIAMDGSQKIPQRWLETLAHNEQQGRTCPAIREGLAAWVHHLQGHNGPVDDPMADKLTRAAKTDTPMIALFGERGLLTSSWRPQ